MTEQGTFPEGLIHEGGVFKNFSIEEETFGHTLALANDPAIAAVRLDDPAYYSAALFARRLTVEGVAQVTPEMVLALSGPDGRELVNVSVLLETRRLQFRSAAQAAPDENTGAS